MRTSLRLTIAAFGVAIFSTSTSTIRAQFYSTTNNGTITITGFTGSPGIVTIPDRINGLPVTSIGESAFTGCRGLASITIPSSVTTIADYAFSWCSGLTSVTIPNGVTTIGDDAFGSCSGLTAIAVEALDPAYSSKDGVLFDKSETNLITCPAGKVGSYTIPSSVNTIGTNAFDGCGGLTSITIPNGVTTIGDSAFSGCYGLT